MIGYQNLIASIFGTLRGYKGEITMKNHTISTETHKGSSNAFVLSHTITVAKKSVYGNDLLYVISEHKDSICQLTGKKTVDESDIKALRGLGFEVQVLSINF